MKTNAFKLTALTSILAGLSACGGGGGDDSPTVSSATYPVAAVYARELSTASSYTVSASDSSGTYFVTVSDTPRGEATFEGITRSVSLSTFTVKRGDALVSTASSISYYGLNPPRKYGSIDTNGEYTVYSATGTMPTTAKVGDTWSGYIGTVYNNSSKSTVLYNLTRNWSLEADSPNTAYLCANTVQSGSSATGSNCKKIDTAGNVLGYRVTLMINGQSFTFR